MIHNRKAPIAAAELQMSIAMLAGIAGSIIGAIFIATLVLSALTKTPAAAPACETADTTTRSW